MKSLTILTRPIGVAALALFCAVGTVHAAPIHTDNANVSSWNVGSGQFNGNFSVTTDDDFAGGKGIQIGLRAQQRRVGPIAPTFSDQTPLDGYVVQAGVDPGTTNRAWWNFQISVGFGAANGDAASIDNLSALTLVIQKIAGTNSGPAMGGVYDLLSLRGVIDDRNVNGDGTYQDIYQISQNPMFGWFDPTYSLALDETFAYRFAVFATDGNDTVVSSMCVATAGLDCAATVPAPGVPALVGLGLLALGLHARRSGTR